MKKQLLVTTTLVAAGLVASAGVAPEALAQEGFEVSVGGFYRTAAAGILDQDDGVGQPGNGIREFTIHDAGEMQFTASINLDNGLKIAARIEYEAVNQGGGVGSNIVDERYITFSGSFGQLRIGSDEGPGSAMQYVAPAGNHIAGLNSPTFGFVAAGANAAGTSTWLGYLGGDGQKIKYFTPRVQGFQLGLSYQPDDFLSEGPIATETDNTIGAQSDIVSVAANYVATLNEIDVAVAGSYTAASLEANLANAFEDREVATFGLNVGYQGFTVGGSYLTDDNGLVGSFDTDTWDIGINYSTGPWTVGVTYLHSETELDVLFPNDDELDAWAIGATYNLGPGADLYSVLKNYDFQSDVVADTNDALVFVLGTTVSF